MNSPPEDQVDTHVYVRMPEHLRKRLYGENAVPGAFPPDRSRGQSPSYPYCEGKDPEKVDKEKMACC